MDEDFVKEGRLTGLGRSRSLMRLVQRSKTVQDSPAEVSAGEKLHKKKRLREQTKDIILKEDIGAEARKGTK